MLGFKHCIHGMGARVALRDLAKGLSALTQQEAHVGGDTTSHHMAVDLVHDKPKKVLMVVANPTTSSNNGWPVGFWASELTHPYFELTERGVEVTIASPDGGKVEFDNLSDPRDPSKWSAEDLISMGFIHTPDLMALLQKTPKLSDLNYDDFDALLVCGGQSPATPPPVWRSCRGDWRMRCASAARTTSREACSRRSPSATDA